MKKLKAIPRFKNESEESRFWELNDSVDYLDWNRAEKVKFVNLKPSTETISLRLPVSLLAKIKIEANEKDIPYQSYIKVLLSNQLQK